MNAAYRTRNKAPQYNLASDVRLFLQVLLVAAPALLLLVYFLLVSGESNLSKLIISILVLLWIVVLANLVRQKFLYQMRTLSTLVEGIRVEDYSFRSSRGREPGDLGDLYRQVNALADQLQSSHQKEQELRNLLEKIICHINVAIVACDSQQRIRLVNPLAAQLLACPADTLVGQEFSATVLGQLPFSDEPSLIDFKFPGAEGRWQLIEQQYRDQGRPGKLLFITDLKQVLREEETKAWQRLIRVIAHEVNNSLTPISSISQTLQAEFASNPAIQQPQMLQGMELIGERAEHLKQFIAEYARIARLPEPQKMNVSLAPLLTKAVQFFAEKPVNVNGPLPDITLFADALLIEQLLINLIKNAVEACNATGGLVELSCNDYEAHCEIIIRDEGVGISNSANLFVPFYTTKQKGSGIGLALCRQIAESHRGSVSLENREDGCGAIAKLILPTSLRQAS